MRGSKMSHLSCLISAEPISESIHDAQTLDEYMGCRKFMSLDSDCYQGTAISTGVNASLLRDRNTEHDSQVLWLALGDSFKPGGTLPNAFAGERTSMMSAGISLSSLIKKNKIGRISGCPLLI